MNQYNKYGLSRRIPEPVARDIRQRCGFGCVKCGLAIYQYHHFDPPFKHAKEHKEDGITLLCPTCHELEKKGLLSSNTVEQYNGSPVCMKRGFSNVCFDLQQNTEVILGNISFINTPNMIEAFGKSLLKIEPPEDRNHPFTISAIFHDASGNEIAVIRENEWQGNVESWDINSEGNKIIIRERIRKISLILRIEPPSKLVIERLNMFYKGFRIVACEGKDTIVYLPDGNVWFRTSGMSINSCAHGIVIE
jgi:hypothetical protein